MRYKGICVEGIAAGEIYESESTVLQIPKGSFDPKAASGDIKFREAGYDTYYWTTIKFASADEYGFWCCHGFTIKDCIETVFNLYGQEHSW